MSKFVVIRNLNRTFVVLTSNKWYYSGYYCDRIQVQIFVLDLKSETLLKYLKQYKQQATKRLDKW